VGGDLKNNNEESFVFGSEKHPKQKQQSHPKQETNEIQQSGPYG
jgi:hypothetical protein